MDSKKLFFLLLLLLLLVNFCSTQREIETEPVRQTPAQTWQETGEGLVQTGIASWYGDKFHGRRTANSEIYDMYKLTAAHKELPFHTLVEVKNLDNQTKVIVRINDRGPFIDGRIIDLSKKAAQRIGIDETGTARVRLRIVKAADIGRDTFHKEQPTVVPQTDRGEYYLQAGAFRSMKNAKELSRYIRRSLPGISFKIDYKEGFYKIRSEKLFSREEAENLKDRLDQLGIDAFVREELGKPPPGT